MPLRLSPPRADRGAGLVALTAGTAMLVALYAGRVLRSETGLYGFLLFNLALAWIPWVAAELFAGALDRRRRGLAVLLGLAWLAFLPNAPYLVTDFVHLRPRARIPLWYDVLLLGDAALTGLLAGAFSLRTVHRAVRRAAGPLAARAVVALAVPATGFGIFLGRFERLNSWDLLADPGAVLAAATAHALSPRAAVVTLATAGLSAVAYLAVEDLALPRLARSTVRSAEPARAAGGGPPPGC